MTEYKLSIPLELGRGRITTKRIVGKLDCLIIKVPSKTEIYIESELGYMIFHSDEIMETMYIPLRREGQNHRGNKLNMQSFEFNLNEKLIITSQSYSYINPFVPEQNKQNIQLIIRTI